jgi:periplasmic protein TonB
VIRLLLAAAVALAAHAALFLWELPPARALIERPAYQAVSIHLVALPAMTAAQPVPEPPPRPPMPVRPSAPTAPVPQKKLPRVAEPVPPRAVIPAPEESVPQHEEVPPDAISAEEPPLAEDAAPGPPPRTPRTAESTSLHVSVPRYDLNPPIVYPAPARRRNLEGTVLLDVLVSAQGRPVQVNVARSSGHTILDSSAVDAVRRWRFEPARRGETAVEMWVQVPVRYALN